MKRKNLVTRIYETLCPKVGVNYNDKTFEVLHEGFFFYHLTEAYYALKGYRRIDS